ncbi:MAG TPA: DUF1415 family protein [Polyangia bacterium]|nr:DUF1415 family protein [Polyangia bacterium]
MSAESPLVAETLRLNARYVEEVVIGWGLCPWAAQAWRDGGVARRVLAEPAAAQASEISGVLAFIDEIAARPAISIGLAIFPHATLTEAAWGAFAERVRRADQARRAPQEEAPFLLAAFHPGNPAPARTGTAPLDAGAVAVANAGALVSFIRRTPDPMLQLVRASLIDGLARGGRDLSGEIARANFATVNARTTAALDALVGEIRGDRNATYARLGLV